MSTQSYRLGDARILEGTVERLGIFQTAAGWAQHTLLLVDLAPALFGKTHAWLLIGRSVERLGVQPGDRLRLRATPTPYRHRSATQRGQISLGLKDPRNITIITRVAAPAGAPSCRLGGGR